MPAMPSGRKIGPTMSRASSHGVGSVGFTSTGTGLTSSGAAGVTGLSGAAVLISRRKFSTMPDIRVIIVGVRGVFIATIFCRMFSS